MGGQRGERTGANNQTVSHAGQATAAGNTGGCRYGVVLYRRAALVAFAMSATAKQQCSHAPITAIGGC